MLFLAFGKKVPIKPVKVLEGIDVQPCGDEFILYLHESLRPLGQYQVLGLSTMITPFTGYHDQFCWALAGYDILPDWIVFDMGSIRRVGSL
jgi:hypothetical protein